MSWLQHDDNCKGCMPVILDPSSMKPLPEDHPAMKAIMMVWNQMNREEKEMFHNFTCNNSRDEKVLEFIGIMNARIQAASEFLEQKEK